jgi:hypothetical protein
VRATDGPRQLALLPSAAFAALVAFVGMSKVMGLNDAMARREPRAGVSTDDAPRVLNDAFNISEINVLPLVMLVFILGCFTQWDSVKAFADTELSGNQWLICIAGGVVIGVVSEIRKLLLRRDALARSG